MLRVAVASGMAAVGYLLLYAGVAGGGTYALRPWDALAAPQAGSAGGQGSQAKSGSGGGPGGLLGGVGRFLRRVFGIVTGPAGIG